MALLNSAAYPHYCRTDFCLSFPKSITIGANVKAHTIPIKRDRANERTGIKLLNASVPNDKMVVSIERKTAMNVMPFISALCEKKIKKSIEIPSDKMSARREKILTEMPNSPCMPKFRIRQKSCIAIITSACFLYRNKKAMKKISIYAPILKRIASCAVLFNAALIAGNTEKTLMLESAASMLLFV